MAVEIVSLGQKQPTLFENTSVVYVITQEDIRRSEVTSIPEALRMVPGVQVDRLSDQQWAIKIQGLLDRLVNTLLVMIDGCLVSKSLLTGTTWDMRDTMLEDIERIEVSRESAETSRGVNAINGVIHIFTTHGRNNQEF
ncbi:MAG: TonB-dependent receptor plug domain-containing protein [Nitrospirales bacterium]|nr:TonB-dependent receptor [Nitrospira sp.]MDR4501401.1 TonB-dependent receptor plug domain-containing protein [Nitrospirales bacterium]